MSEILYAEGEKEEMGDFRGYFFYVMGRNYPLFSKEEGLSSMDQCNTMSKCFAMEGVVSGTIRPSWVVGGPERHCLGTMEAGAAIKRYRANARQRSWLDSPGHLLPWGHFFPNSAMPGLPGLNLGGTGGNFSRSCCWLFPPPHRGKPRAGAFHGESRSGSMGRIRRLSAHIG